MRALRKKGVLGQLVILGAVAAALLLRNIQVLAGLMAAVSLGFLWSVLRRDNDQLRRDFADYPGPVGAPLAWLISKLPASGPKIVCCLLGAGLFGFLLFGLFHWTTPPSGPLGRAALAARANSICATELNTLEDPGSDPQPAINQELKDIEAITPAASLRPDWRRVVAGLVAQNHFTVSFTLTHAQKAADSRAENKGNAAERRLGIRC